MNDKTPLIAPCPFCGELEGIVTKFEGSPVGDSYAVVCGNCDAQGPPEDTGAEAVESWAGDQERIEQAADATDELDRLFEALDRLRKRVGR